MKSDKFDGKSSWFGELPEFWKGSRLGYCSKIGNGSTPDRDNPEFWIDGTIPWLTSSKVNQGIISEADQYVTELAFRSCHLPMAPAESVVVGITGEGQTRGRAALLAFNATVSQHLAVVSPKRKILEPRFLWNILIAYYSRLRWESSGGGSTKAAITCEFLRGVPIPLPPLGVQRQIVELLERKTAAIDSLIARKQRLLELLAEKRAAIINQAVTKGLDPNVPMKDSGMSWIREIPAHWTPVNLRQVILGISQGWSPVAEDRVTMGAEEWGVLKLSAISSGSFFPEEHKALASLDIPRPELEIHEGDLLITRGNTPELVGDSCIVRHCRPRIMLSDLVYRVELNCSLADPAFVNLFLLSSSGRAAITADARGSSQSMVKISQSHILSWKIALPPLSEQQSVVAATEDEMVRILALVHATEQQVGKLQEYRQALITAAVTGQLEIPVECSV